MTVTCYIYFYFRKCKNQLTVPLILIFLICLTFEMLFLDTGYNMNVMRQPKLYIVFFVMHTWASEQSQCTIPREHLNSVILSTANRKHTWIPLKQSKGNWLCTLQYFMHYPQRVFSEVSTFSSPGCQNLDHNANLGLQETKPQLLYIKKQMLNEEMSRKCFSWPKSVCAWERETSHPRAFCIFKTLGWTLRSSDMSVSTRFHITRASPSHLTMY